MIISCPDCGQPLRVPDHLENPLLRCRRCQSTFRPLDLETPEPVVDAESVYDEPEPEPEMYVSVSPAPASARRNKKKVGRGLGVIALILFILISKAPRLLKKLFDDRPKEQPVPVHLNEKEMQELNRLFNEERQPPEPDGGEAEAFPNVNVPRR
ncbi:MAG: hypothetical protein ACC628_11305 [Pirellulaceae bacterium]